MKNTDIDQAVRIARGTDRANALAESMIATGMAPKAHERTRHLLPHQEKARERKPLLATPLMNAVLRVLWQTTGYVTKYTIQTFVSAIQYRTWHVSPPPLTPEEYIEAFAGTMVGMQLQDAYERFKQSQENNNDKNAGGELGVGGDRYADSDSDPVVLLA